MNYDQLSGLEWRRLLYTQPQLADICAWDKLDGWNWSCLLCKQPQFADKCDWDKLSSWDWWCVLIERPNILNNLSEGEKKRAVVLNVYALQYIDNPSDDLIRLHKVKHEL